MDDSNSSTQDGQIFLYGNWKNNAGDSSFLQGQSTIHLIGNTTQVINDNDYTRLETFGNLVLGNAAGTINKIFNTSISNNLYAEGTLIVHPNASLIIKKKNDTSDSFVEIVGNLTNNGSITIESDANLIQRTGSYSGYNITVKRNADLKRLDYNYWGSPVMSQHLRSFSSNTLVSRFYVYNEANDYFDGIFVSNKYPDGSSSITPLQDPDTYHFQTGKGYAIRASNYASPSAPQTFAFSFLGLPHNGIISVPVTKSPDTIINGVTYEHGYNLISNPYPSNIDLDKFFNDNPTLVKTAYFWTNINPNPAMQGSQYPKSGSINNYAIYSATGGLGAPSPACNEGGANCSKIPNNIIKVGQGFLIKTLASGNITFSNTQRSRDFSGKFFNKMAVEAPQKDRFWLSLKTPLSFQNPILIGYIKGASNQLDLGYDALLMVEGADSFYSIVEDEKLAIQGKKAPLILSDKVILGVTFYETGTHTISLDNKEGVFAKGQPIYLHDNLTDTYTDLQKTSYSFMAEKGEVKDRFQILYTLPYRTLETTEVKEHELKIYEQGNQYIVEAKNKIKELKIFDAAGRCIYTIKGKNNSLIIENNKLSKGINIFSVIFAERIINKKIRIK